VDNGDSRAYGSKAHAVHLPGLPTLRRTKACSMQDRLSGCLSIKCPRTPPPAFDGVFGRRPALPRKRDDRRCRH